jgi:hypothetical protein
MRAHGAPRAAIVALAVVALVACRDRAPAPREQLGPAVVEPVPDPRPRPAEVAHLTLKVLGMT